MRFSPQAQDVRYLLLNGVGKSLHLSFTPSPSTRLAPAVARVLVPLVTSNLGLALASASCGHTSSCVAASLSQLAAQLPQLVTQLYNRPVAASSAGEGVLVQPGQLSGRDLARLRSAAGSQLQLLVLSCEPEAGGRVTVQLCGDRAPHLNTFSSCGAAAIVAAEVARAGAGLVLAATSLQTELRTQLASRGVAVAECVGKEVSRMIGPLHRLPA